MSSHSFLAEELLRLPPFFDPRSNRARAFLPGVSCRAKSLSKVRLNKSTTTGSTLRDPPGRHSVEQMPIQRFNQGAEGRVRCKGALLAIPCNLRTNPGNVLIDDCAEDSRRSIFKGPIPEKHPSLDF
jgi:hypothetical protein